MIELNVQYIKSVNLALINNGIDICESALLESKDNDIREVMVECSGEYFCTTASAVIPVIPRGKSIRLTDLHIKPSTKMMDALTEKVSTLFTIAVWTNAD